MVFSLLNTYFKFVGAAFNESAEILKILSFGVF